MEYLEELRFKLEFGVGTLELLFKNRDHYGTLPHVSATLGDNVRTNSEAISAELHPRGQDLTNGASISNDFHPDAVTHATQNRFDRGYRFMRFYMGPMVDDPVPLRRAIKTIFKALLSPRLMLSNVFSREWEKRITAFTVMQDRDNYIRLQFRRPWWKPWGAPRLVSAAAPGHEAPTYLPVANQLTREYARAAGGVPMNLLMESIGNQSSTAHILCGALLFDHSIGFAGIREYYTRKLLCKGLFGTTLISTEKTFHSQVEYHRPICPC